MELNVESYPSAEAFLDRYHADTAGPRCLVLDVRLSGLSGLGLQQMLVAEVSFPPVIMISGCADISMAVKAMLGGAMDFLEKPISRQTLASRIRQALDADVRGRLVANGRQELVRRVARLSARQRDVLDLLVTGARSKQIAHRLGIGEKTVAKHRAAVLERM
jgi:FixJ family two-component response regulator